MGMMGSRLRLGWVLAVIGALALVGACSLNPQPIPPGETDGTSQGADGGGPNATTGNGDGGNGSADATIPFQADDAGDAGDSGDEDAADAGDT